MRKFLLLLLLSGSFFSANAQAPGYQGQRFSVGYNVSTFLFFDDLHLGDIFPTARVSYKTELNLHYTLSKSVNAGFSYYFATQKYNDLEDAYIQNSGNFSYSDYYKMKTMMPAKLAIYELSFQFFRHNFIAPTGLYNQFGVGIVKYNLGSSDGTYSVRSTDGSGTILEMKAPTEDYTGFKLSYHIGKTNPISHHFYINTAFGVNFFQGGDTPKIKEGLTYKNYILSELNKGLRRQNFFEIKIGLGWFAF